MIDMALITIQCFFLYILAHYLQVAPLINGIMEKLHTKHKRNYFYIINIFLTFVVLFGGLFIITKGYESIYFWYALTLITVILSSYAILTIDGATTPIETPSTLRDYVTNARYEIVDIKTLKILSKLKFVIYLLYIVVTILNQIGKLGDNVFSHSMYLQLNEYSLIILFAICEAVKIFSKKTHTQL